MSAQQLLVGSAPLHTDTPPINGEFVQYQNRDFYKIAHYDQMRPFFISLVSHNDQWLFLSSNGGLTAGRKNPDHALFPYYTDDKIHDSTDQTGSKTICIVSKGGKNYYWEPFGNAFAGVYQIERHLYKSTLCNELLFEEYNADLGLSFTYGYAFSETYGLVKTARLHNRGIEDVDIQVVDGLQNLLPFGVEIRMQTERSTLLDAYKKNELLADSALGLFLMSSVPVDRAEPSEALKATTVWQTGLEAEVHLLSNIQLPKLRRGEALISENDVRAERGCYFVQSQIKLAPALDTSWMFVLELNQGPSQVVALHEYLKRSTKVNLAATLQQDIAKGSTTLEKIVGAADGLQQSTDRPLTTRHFANVLFNVMRGGIFNDHYRLPKDDFIQFLRHTNTTVATQHQSFLAELPELVDYLDLQTRAAASGDLDLQRLCREYLPLIFSRRHGDPSRPWNRFSIELVDEQGYAKFYYQGNWRDIFQNWEALAMSYPHYLESIITKFVNASTPDGYNPYRITRDGIDWETIEPDDPWSYIGYWGDHQIIYLLKLLELLQTYQPGALQKMLHAEAYVYADVPYRIRSYADLLADPQETVDFDHAAHQRSMERVAQMGADGKFVQDERGMIRVNLAEKLLLTLLTKLSNFIPEAGIWMNTQRPEWNDANNALVGYGVSMVTLNYVRRFIQFLRPALAQFGEPAITVTAELHDFTQELQAAFTTFRADLQQARTNQLRREITDLLGQAGERYRNKVYAGFSREQGALQLHDLDQLLANVLACIDHTIKANRREDGLYHSYNLMKIDPEGGIAVRYLYEMLEGQVAVLSSGFLSPAESLPLLQALRASPLYRADQHSYLLYPDRQLPRFEAKNNLPAEAVESSTLLQAMLVANDQRIIEQDEVGHFHFNGNFNNAKDVKKVLNRLSAEQYPQNGPAEQQRILDIFEEVFDHQSFTGRSGTFFGYEGLGCIYWHMVSKLILAAAENCRAAIEAGADSSTIDALIEKYYDLRAGLGTHKSPEVYGAFPSDPYSHTPGNAGAQQPGMTGQVKEDIISRFYELGLWLADGALTITPRMLYQSEFLSDSSTFEYVQLDGTKASISLGPNSLAFTYCQVPFVYQLGDRSEIELEMANGQSETVAGLHLNAAHLAPLFARDGRITSVKVTLNPTEVTFATL